MTPLEGFIIGYLAGIVFTFIGIMVFTKFMPNRDTVIESGKLKLNKK